MRWLDKYLVYSSIFAMFTEAFSFHYIIDWKLFYVIIAINYVLLATRKKLTIHKNILILLLFFLAHGVLFYFIYHNPIKSLIAQLAGISFSAIYYYNFLNYYGTKYSISKYLEISLIVAVSAVFMFLLDINVFIYNRLNGILTEPAHYVAIVLPATYIFFREKKYIRFLVMLLTILMAKSTIGYLGIVFILLLPLLKVRYFLKYWWAVAFVLGFSSYYISTQWNKPIDENESNVLVRRLKETNESLTAIYTGKFQKYTNLSSYAFLSNTFITKNILFEKPLGTGLGSYPHEYEKYYPKLSPPEYLVTLKQSKINKTDANSLFLRMVANFGIIAFIFILYFVYRSFKLFKDDTRIIQQSTFFYLALKLIREGHYFPPEFYFFLLIFLKDFDEHFTHS